ncbi:hypothetical protein [Rhodoplanes serenus]|uniref:hypothetical protein n=1 Tax=Rhodoplanes serenus TaxID=200615 RepID=UPI000DABF9BE|nr:hypothetical protein [Rhodoplanes serenus]RAI33885.1 hypothetical protein CH340_10835 [Rhodoplanes serenus]
MTQNLSVPNRPRVVVSDLPRPRELRPSHFTLDTFTGAPRPILNDDKQRLGQALAAFGASLSGLASVAAAREKKAANDAATAEAYRTIAAESADPQFGAKVAAGHYPVQATEVGSGLLMAEAGQRQARAATEAFQLGVKDGTIPLIDENGIPIPLEQAMRQYAARFMTTPGNPHFMKSFSTGLESVMTGFHEQQRNAVANYNRGRLEQLTKNGIEEVIGLAASGADDERVKQTWAGLTRQARQYTGTDPAVMDARWIGRLREMIQSDDPKQWDIAERLLKLDRTGYDGQKLGPLGAKPEFRKDVAEFSDMLLAKRAGLYDRRVEDAKVREAVDALKRGDASFHGITDTAYVNPFVPGNSAKDPNRYVTASTIKQRAAAQYEAESLAEFRRQSSDPSTEAGAKQVFFERTYGAYVHNNIPNPKWKAKLEDGTRGLSDPTTASCPRPQWAPAPTATSLSSAKSRKTGKCAR